MNLFNYRLLADRKIEKPIKQKIVALYFILLTI